MTDRAAARAVAALFILATVPFSISVVVLEPLLTSPDVLGSLAQNPGRVGIGVLLELVNHIAVVGIAVVIFPILKRVSERVAMGYVAARSVEAALFGVATLHLLTLVYMSGEVGAATGAGQPGWFVSVLLAGHDWDRAMLPFTAFGLGAVLLNYALYRSRLVPRWISGFGLLAAASILVARILLLVGVPLTPSTVVAMDGPIFLQEMVFAVWLLYRGFDTASPLNAASS